MKAKEKVTKISEKVEEHPLKATASGFKIIDGDLKTFKQEEENGRRRNWRGFRFSGRRQA